MAMVSFIPRSVILFICLYLVYVPSSFAAPQPKKTFVLGAISNKPLKSFERLKPLSLYLEKELKVIGIEKVKIKIVKTRQEMQNFLDEKKIDMFSETLLTAIQLNNVDYDILRWKKGVPNYKTLIITQANTPIYQLEDLIGKTIALEDKQSTSSYLIPMLTLLDKGLPPHKKKNLRAKNTEKKVNYVFANQPYSATKQNLSIWSEQRLVDAAAIADNDWHNEKKFPTQLKQQLRIIYQSEPIPRSLMIVRNSLPKKTKQSLYKILTTAHNTSDSELALQAFQKTKKFTLLNKEMILFIEQTKTTYQRHKTQLE